jgi:hypothetical protein
MCKNNKTNTFGQISEYKSKLNFRIIMNLIERLFLKGKPIAIAKKLKIVMESLKRLFKK